MSYIPEMFLWQGAKFDINTKTKIKEVASLCLILKQGTCRTYSQDHCKDGVTTPGGKKGKERNVFPTPCSRRKEEE